MPQRKAVKKLIDKAPANLLPVIQRFLENMLLNNKTTLQK